MRRVRPCHQTAPNPVGITTASGSGVITIAPKVKSAAGKNATLGKFASSVGMTLNAAELKLPGGKLYQDGDSCQGHPGHVYVKQFSFVGDTTGQLYNGEKGQLPKVDPRQVLLADSKLVTIAFVPASGAASIPAPPEYVNTNLRAATASSTTSTTTTPAASTATTTPTPSTTTKSTSTTAKP